LLDVTASQTQPSAECARPLGQSILVDADQRRRVVRHDRHPRVDDRAAVTLGGEACCATAQQAGNHAFDHGSALSTRVGEVHLAWGPGSRPALLAQEPNDVRRRGRGGEGRDRVRDPHGENPLRVQRLTQGGVMARHIAGQRVKSRFGIRRDSGNRPRHLVDQGLHRAGITRIAHGQMQGNDEARRRRDKHPGCAATRRGAVALPCTDGREGGIVGVDDGAVSQRLALREPAGWVFDPVLGGQGSRALGGQARPLLLRQRRRAAQARRGGPRQGPNRLASLQPWPLGLAYQCHTHVAHPPALSAEAAHQLLEGVLEWLRVRRQCRTLGGALGGYRDDAL